MWWGILLLLWRRKLAFENFMWLQKTISNQLIRYARHSKQQDQMMKTSRILIDLNFYLNIFLVVFLSLHLTKSLLKIKNRLNKYVQIKFRWQLSLWFFQEKITLWFQELLNFKIFLPYPMSTNYWIFFRINRFSIILYRINDSHHILLETYQTMNIHELIPILQ